MPTYSQVVEGMWYIQNLEKVLQGMSVKYQHGSLLRPQARKQKLCAFVFSSVPQQDPYCLISCKVTWNQLTAIFFEGRNAGGCKSLRWKGLFLCQYGLTANKYSVVQPLNFPPKYLQFSSTFLAYESTQSTRELQNSPSSRVIYYSLVGC